MKFYTSGFILVIGIFALASSAFYIVSNNHLNHKSKFEAPSSYMKGLSLVAPPDEFTTDPMPAIVDINADWVAVIPYGFTRKGEAKLYHNTDRQWWGEKLEGAIETIKLAQASGLQIMMKPQVWIHNEWTGNLSYPNDEEWAKWEDGYRAYIMSLAEVSETFQVPLFCLGTEFRTSIAERPAFWDSLIEEIKTVYSGKLTYAANWDDFDKVPFWDKLDYIGINAYFPLTEEREPSIKKLKKEWKKEVPAIRNISKKYSKQIIFTEYGYLSVEGCAGKTWELEKNRKALTVSEQAQSNAIAALWKTFQDEPYWLGGFLWKWYPTKRSRYYEKDYTPQDKIAQEKLTEIWLTK